MRDDPSGRIYESRRLCTSIRFSTYSDARLAGLFLDNDFPIVLFKKVFDVVLDPDFKPEEVTFEDVWDMFVFISGRRKKNASQRELAPTALAPAVIDTGTCPGEGRNEEADRIRATPGVIPPLVLDLVVSRLIEDRMPLGVAASDPWWPSAFQSNIEPFYSMSLVHRSWSTIAQRGLRQRVVIPYQHIGRFLLSPFCGPWITEMIVYWSVENGSVGVTKGDIWLLEALLERTTNLRSLSFNTSLIWSKDFLRPSFDVGICLEIMSDLLPNLENLWLKHTPEPVSENEECLVSCNEIRSLYQQLPKLRALKFLSLSSWGSATEGEGSSRKQLDLNWNEHPPPALKSVELSLCEGLQNEDLAWSLKPRDAFRLESLALTTRIDNEKDELHSTLREALGNCATAVKALRLCILGASGTSAQRTEATSSPPFYTDSLLCFTGLQRLVLVVVDETVLNWSSIFIPSSLQHLEIHLQYDFLRRHLHPYPSPSHPRSVTPFVQQTKRILSTLPNLHTLRISGFQDLSVETVQYLDLDDFLDHINLNQETGPSQDNISDDLSAFCKERGVCFTLTSRITPYRRWDEPRELG